MIENIKKEDISDITYLYNQIDQQHRELYPEEFLPASSVSRNDDYYIDIINSPEKEIFVAKDNDRIVGFIEIHISKKQGLVFNKRKTGYVFTIVINPKCRNQGFGKKLMEKANEWFKMNNIKELELVVFNKNQIGKSFFNNIGFKEKYCLLSKKI